MPRGTSGKFGSSGNEKSVTYGFLRTLSRPNPCLSAIFGLGILIQMLSSATGDAGFSTKTDNHVTHLLRN